MCISGEAGKFDSALHRGSSFPAIRSMAPYWHQVFPLPWDSSAYLTEMIVQAYDIECFCSEQGRSLWQWTALLCKLKRIGHKSDFWRMHRNLVQKSRGLFEEWLPRLQDQAWPFSSTTETSVLADASSLFWTKLSAGTSRWTGFRPHCCQDRCQGKKIQEYQLYGESNFHKFFKFEQVCDQRSICWHEWPYSENIPNRNYLAYLALQICSFRNTPGKHWHTQGWFEVQPPESRLMTSSSAWTMWSCSSTFDHLCRQPLRETNQSLVMLANLLFFWRIVWISVCRTQRQMKHLKQALYKRHMQLRKAWHIIAVVKRSWNTGCSLCDLSCMDENHALAFVMLWDDPVQVFWCLLLPTDAFWTVNTIRHPPGFARIRISVVWIHTPKPYWRFIQLWPTCKHAS